MEDQIKQAKLREEWHVRSVNMAQEVNDYSKVEGMIADWWLTKLSQAKLETLEAIIKEVESTLYVFERDKDDYLPEVYKHLKSKNEAREEMITTLQAELEIIKKEI